MTVKHEHWHSDTDTALNGREDTKIFKIQIPYNIYPVKDILYKLVFLSLFHSSFKIYQTK